MTTSSDRERPILFSPPMVRAIIEGRKTQTRRVARLTCAGHVREPTTRGHYRRWHPDDPEAVLACPYGQPGDRLWVRERFAPYRVSSVPSSIDEAEYVLFCDGAQMFRKNSVYYPGAYDGGMPMGEYAPGAFDGIRWRPSLHMPRWASRISLEVVGVRLERLQKITEEDAQSEGVGAYVPCDGNGGAKQGPAWFRINFSHLWDSIYGKRAPWVSNPLVWVVTFKLGLGRRA
jgi:hypothetical protein